MTSDFPILGESHVDSILNSLYAGDKVKIGFTSELERQSFRKRLYSRKAQQDYLLSKIISEPKKILRHQEEGSYSIYWLEARKRVEFEILSKETPNEEVSGNLGQVTAFKEEDARS